MIALSCTSITQPEDCLGIAGGNAIEDECGVCDGDTSSCNDCAGVPNGDSLIDSCEVCDDNTDNDCVQDCAGEWGGPVAVDE